MGLGEHFDTSSSGGGGSGDCNLCFWVLYLYVGKTINGASMLNPIEKFNVTFYTGKYLKWTDFLRHLTRTYDHLSSKGDNDSKCMKWLIICISDTLPVPYLCVGHHIYHEIEAECHHHDHHVCHHCGHHLHHPLHHHHCVCHHHHHHVCNKILLNR